MNPLPLEGRLVVVTGAGRRLGRAVAEGIVDAGADVVLVANRSADAAGEVAARARALGHRGEVVEADLSDRCSTDAAVARILAAHPSVDALVHAAASFERGNLATTDDAGWDQVLELNLTAPFRLVRALAPALSASPCGGSVVLFADLAAFLPFPEHFAHSVAKGAIVSLTRTLARSLAPKVRVNAVAPGASLPPEDFTELEKRIAFERIPMGDAGGADEVVRAVVHLLASTRVTGEVLRVDGGRGLR